MYDISKKQICKKVSVCADYKLCVTKILQYTYIYITYACERVFLGCFVVKFRCKKGEKIWMKMQVGQCF